MANEPHVWVGRSRKGHEQFASTEGWGDLAACKGDDRFIDRTISDETAAELIDMCNTICAQRETEVLGDDGQPLSVKERCLLWAHAQTQPVGFSVAGGERWKAWNHCAICGKKVRGINRCPKHIDVGEPAGTIEADGTGRPYRLTDEH